jgi:hypothetical protein
MKPTVEHLRSGALFLVTWYLAVVILGGRAVSADAPPTACAAPAYHQFDFWTGDWDVFDVGSPI